MLRHLCHTHLEGLASYAPVVIQNSVSYVMKITHLSQHNNICTAISPHASNQLYRETMALIEETNRYSYGEGRDMMRHMSPAVVRFYTHQVMQLSTRLMQTAALLLLARAVTEGDMTIQDMERERAKIMTNYHAPEAPNPLWAQVPEAFCVLNQKSLLLAWRVSHLVRDSQSQEQNPLPFKQGANAVEKQMNRLKEAFANSG